MAVMAKWRNKTFEVSRKKVNPLKNFSTSTTIKGDDSKSKKKKTELVPFTFDIDVHANAGVNPQKEYESWCSLIKSTGVLYSARPSLWQRNQTKRGKPLGRHYGRLRPDPLRYDRAHVRGSKQERNQRKIWRPSCRLRSKESREESSQEKGQKSDNISRQQREVDRLILCGR